MANLALRVARHQNNDTTSNKRALQNSHRLLSKKDLRQLCRCEERPPGSQNMIIQPRQVIKRFNFCAPPFTSREAMMHAKGKLFAPQGKSLKRQTVSVLFDRISDEVREVK